MPPLTSPPGYFEVGDQFAAGARQPMDAYAKAWSWTRDAPPNLKYGMLPGYHGHINVAVSTLHQGVRAEQLLPVTFGPELDPEKPSPRLILDLLMTDISQRNPDPIDQTLLAAAEAGCRDAA
jgi:hypothetical protein